MLELDKNVPMPLARRRGASGRTAEFHEVLGIMQVGDSVKFPYSEEVIGEQFRAIAVKNFGYGITRRTSDDKTTIRYWRVK